MFSFLFKKKESDLTGTQFKNQLESDKSGLLLDVRTSSEFQSGSIPKAKNIDFMSSDFKRKIAALDQSKTYYVFCRSGNRSGSAVSIMTKEGFKAYNLVGGIGAFPR